MPVPGLGSGASAPDLPAGDRPKDGPTQSPPAVSGLEVQPKDKKQLPSERVQNPHEPEATYAAKGQGDHWKEHVGYKIQVAETVCEATLAPGEPTRNFIVGIVTHPAYESDEAAPPPATNNEGRFTSDRFRVEVEQRRATCPAGHQNTQCSRLEEQATKRVSFRFEWDTGTCAACPLRGQCIGGTQSELVRGHDVRHARYRGLAKTKLQNYFTGAACNVKRWLRRTAWKMRQAAAAAGQGLAATAN